MRKKRHNYTPEEKVSILRRHLVEHVAVYPTCVTSIISSPGFSIAGRSSFLRTEQRHLSVTTDLKSVLGKLRSSSLKPS